MPNWCAGSLKVRGDVKNVIRFLEEGLEPVSFMGDDTGKKVKVEGYTDEPTDTDILYCSTNETCHIKNTYRGFVRGLDLEFWTAKDSNEVTIVIEDVEFAWSIDTGGLLQTCQDFGVDMRMYGFERGMEFNKEVEIVNGEVKTDRIIKFDDYDWECPMPRIGG